MASPDPSALWFSNFPPPKQLNACSIEVRIIAYSATVTYRPVGSFRAFILDRLDTVYNVQKNIHIHTSVLYYSYIVLHVLHQVASISSSNPSAS